MEIGNEYDDWSGIKMASIKSDESAPSLNDEQFFIL